MINPHELREMASKESELISKQVIAEIERIATLHAKTGRTSCKHFTWELTLPLVRNQIENHFEKLDFGTYFSISSIPSSSYIELTW